MVVSGERDASEAGVAVMRAGGNAVDAAVATGFALAVTFPIAGNVGGGGFMVVRFPDGTATTLDYRETAPAAATRDMFLDSTGAFVPERSQVGALASGVPGSVAGLLYAHERWGRLPLADVLAPALALAERGFPLSHAEAATFNFFRDYLAYFPSTARAFVPAVPYAEGDTLRQTDLADVLRRIRDHGRDGFYTGETARLLVAEMERNGGLITADDLAGYRPVEREPVVGTYRGHRVISMGPPSSGGIALLQLLAAVEPFDVREMGFNSSATVHLMAEAMRRTYADRAEWLGDPDVVDVPVAGLVDTAYVRARMATFDPLRTTPSADVAAGQPPHESPQTTHYSVVDADGMAVSTTTTLNGPFGSFLVVGGAGFLLNNEMDDFSAAPGVPNQFSLVGAEANAVGPGKRMLSSMAPTVVEGPDGRLLLVVGSEGGPRIITTVFEAILNVVDHGMTASEVVGAPRVHHQWLPDVLFAERGALARDVADNLRARGWAIVDEDRWSHADAVLVACDAAGAATDPSGLGRTGTTTAGCVLLGGADPRGEDAAAGF
jgi:gamma-glutamyltranspeptidase/glutathione hydrolase